MTYPRGRKSSIGTLKCDRDWAALRTGCWGKPNEQKRGNNSRMEQIAWYV